MTTYHRADVRGRQLFYREAGSKTSPAVVLLHGFPSSSHMFRDLIPQLADKFHVIAPDYVGFGFSDGQSVHDFEYSFDNLASHVEELLFENLGLRHFSIYVQDYGAPSATGLRQNIRMLFKALSFRTAMHTWRGLAVPSTR